MATIAQNLQALIQQKNSLVTTLQNLGLGVTTDTGLGELVSAVSGLQAPSTKSSIGIAKCGPLLTKFAVCSDIHLDSPYEKPYIDDTSDTNKGYKTNRGYIKGTQAFDVLGSMNDLDFIAFNGDCLLQEGGNADVYGSLKTIFDELRGKIQCPLYMIPGNHDSGCSVEVWESVANTSAWDDVTFMSGRVDCYYKEINGDLYIWFGVWNNKGIVYSSSQWEWLWNLLDTNSGRERIFLFTHLYDSSVDGFGWRYLNGTYQQNGWKTENTSHPEFGLIKNYRNVIWFSGHSHTDWEYEDRYPTIKVHARSNTAKMISIPSLYQNGELAIVSVYSNMTVVQPYKRNTVLMPEKIYFIGNGNGTSQTSYSITYNLENVVSSDSSETIGVGGSYIATLSVSNGYENPQVTVEMGGTDITGTAYDSNTGVISISTVTGNIVITASATQSQPQSYTITLNLSGVESSNTANSIIEGETYITTITAGDNIDFWLTVQKGNTILVDSQKFTGSEPITLQNVNGNLIITATTTEPVEETEPDWETLDQTHSEYVKLIYDVTDTTAGTSILADGTQSGQSEYNLSYISDMIIDGTQVTPTRSYQFSTPGKHEVLMRLSDNKFHTGFCYKVGDLWSVSVPSNITASSASCFKGCAKLKYAKFDMTLSGNVVDNFIDEVVSLEVIKFGSGVPGLTGSHALTNVPSLTDLYIYSDTFSIQYSIGTTSIPNSYNVHVKSGFDTTTIQSKLSGATILTDL